MKKKHETSKVALSCNLVFCYAGIAFALYAACVYGLSDASTIVASLCTLAAASIGFYSWKAKAENIAKHARDKVPPVVKEAIRSITDDEYDTSYNAVGELQEHEE